MLAAEVTRGAVVGAEVATTTEALVVRAAEVVNATVREVEAVTTARFRQAALMAIEET